MREDAFSFYGAGEMLFRGTIWMPDVVRPRLVVQVAHGMTEHFGRYKMLAEAVTARGMALAGYDLRGHGCNNPEGACASFGEGGWEASLQDMHACHHALGKLYKDVPQVLLGFSLGSFLVRDYLSMYRTSCAGVIIMGTGSQSSAVLGALKLLVKGEIKKAGFDNTTPLVQKLSFETYNKRFAPNHSAFDWLISDAVEVARYVQDPLCKSAISAGLFWQLLDAMQRTSRPSAYNQWPQNLPVMLMSGREDPVGDGGKGVEHVAKQMKKAGIEDLSMFLMPRARHDVLHEVENGVAEKSISMIVAFLEHCVTVSECL